MSSCASNSRRITNKCSSILVARDIRNTCAHGGRIYTSNTARHFQKLIPDTEIHRQLFIPQNSTGNYIIGKTDVLAILITLKCFSSKSDFRVIKKTFKKAYAKMGCQIPTPVLANIDQEMGLPMEYLQML